MDYTHISDHLPIFILTKLNNDTKYDVTIETRIYNDQTIALFKSIIDTICWNDVYASEDPPKSYTSFLKKISLAYDKSFPLAKKKR